MTRSKKWRPSSLFHYNMNSVHTKSEKETQDLAFDIASKANPGDIFTLTGDLGAGKTTFSKGFAKGLGYGGEITSPTFTLMDIHEINDGLQFVHVDTYRLESTEDVIEIGLTDYLGDQRNICLVEWPEKIQPLLEGKEVTKISIREGADQNERIIEIEN